jgi:hypothetical protein
MAKKDRKNRRPANRKSLQDKPRNGKAGDLEKMSFSDWRSYAAIGSTTTLQTAADRSMRLRQLALVGFDCQNSKFYHISKA